MIFNAELIQGVIDSIDGAIVLVDEAGLVVACNQGWSDGLSLPGIRPVPGKSIDVVLAHVTANLSPPDAAGTGDVAPHLKAIRARDQIVTELSWKNGRQLRLAGTPLSSGAYLLRILEVAPDVREKALARMSVLSAVNESLKRAGELAALESRAQRRFIAAASHDLLQPLHAARLFMGSAREDPQMDPKVSSALDRADRSIAAANSLLRALLSLSKLEVDGLQPAVSRIEISEMFAALHAEFDPLARARGLELVVRPSAAWVFSDQDLLRSVLQNLLANAIRYTQKGRIMLTCRRCGSEHVRIEVRDSGGGIKPEVQQAIFDEFTQLPDRTEAEDAGTGLGLAIVKRICEALGHQLMLRSVLGKGSTFSVTIKSSPVGDQPGHRRPATGKLDRLRLLCIEDDRTVAEALVALLTSWGIKPVVCCTAEEALDLPGEWDAVLATYHLRWGMNGLEALARFSGRAVRRVLITDDSNDNVSAAAIRSGIVVMQKPLSPIILHTLLGH